MPIDLRTQVNLKVDPTTDEHLVNKKYVDDHTSLTAWGDITGTLADQVDLQTELDNLDTALADKMDLVSGATAGHLATLDANGQAVDSGSDRSAVDWGDITGTLADQIDLENALAAIETRIDGIENLGHYVGAFATRAAVPGNTSGFPGGITLNDFITVRADETQNGAVTRYVASAIAADGTITWTYDISYSTDISGKMDLVATAVANNLGMFNASGQITDAGKALADLMDLTSDQAVPGVKSFSPDRTINDADVPYTNNGIKLLHLNNNALNQPDLVATTANFMIQCDNSATYRIQLLLSDSIGGNAAFIRRVVNGVTQPWREILDSAFLTARTLTVDIEDLQTTIDSLPKYLNRDVTINVRAGEITTEIRIERFNGPGILNITGATTGADFSRKVLRVTVQFDTLARIHLQGITSTATTGTSFYFNALSAGMVYVYQCNAIGENVTLTSKYGFYMNESSHVYCSQCTTNGQYIGYWARSGRMRVATPYGSVASYILFNSEFAGILQAESISSATATITYRRTASSILTNSSGQLAGYSPPRRTSDMALVFTTDQLASQTLAAQIEQAVQDTLFVNSNTLYRLRIIIRQGTSTTAALRLHGLNMKFAYVQVWIDPDVTVSEISIYGCVANDLIVTNCGSVNGNVHILYNTALVGDVYYDGNIAGTITPTYPTIHPLGAVPVPIGLSRVTGGINVSRNRGNNVFIRLGGNTQVGVPDAADTITAPSVGTTTAGSLNLNYNRCEGTAYVYLYASYQEVNVPPGPRVAGRIYVYYNQCNYDAYINVMSGWAPGTEAHYESTYLYNNVVGRNAHITIGGSSPMSSFIGYFTNTLDADPSTAARSTVVLNTPLTPEQEAVVVGMGFTTINYSTSSSTGNYTGAFKRVNAYDPATRTITLSATFTNARLVNNATCYFFPYAGQTKVMYPASAKTEIMLDDVLARGSPIGLTLFDGANDGRAYQVTAVNKATRTIEISPALASNSVYNVSFGVAACYGPQSFADYGTTYYKDAPATLRSVGDVRVYSHLVDVLPGVKITGGGIPAGQFRTVTSAEWGTTAGNEQRIILHLDSDDADIPVNPTIAHSYTLRRVPTQGQQGVAYNYAGGSAYAVLGHWSNGADGATRVRTVLNAYNHVGGSVYIECRGFAGNAVNPNGVSRASDLQLYGNFAAYSAYIDARSNGLPGGGGGFDRLIMHRNVCGNNLALAIASYTTVNRASEVYYNTAGYRIYVSCLLAAGVTISATSAPQLHGQLALTRNTSAEIWVNQLNIKPALISENGIATPDRCIVFDHQNAPRVFPLSASLWLDISNNVTANASCMYVTRTPHFDLSFAVPCTYGGTQCYALRVIHSPYIWMAQRPALNPKVKLEGWTQAHYGSTVLTDNIYQDDHSLGRGPNVVIFKNGHTIDLPEAP